MKPLLLQKLAEKWQPTSLLPSSVDPEFHRLNGLQRAVEAWRYIILRCEYWLSPSGDMREWLRHNTRIGVWLLIPAVLVMPIVGLILWQFTGWLAMLASIAGRLIVLPVLTLLAFVVIRTVVALIRR